MVVRILDIIVIIIIAIIIIITIIVIIITIIIISDIRILNIIIIKITETFIVRKARLCISSESESITFLGNDVDYMVKDQWNFQTNIFEGGPMVEEGPIW